MKNGKRPTRSQLEERIDDLLQENQAMNETIRETWANTARLEREIIKLYQTIESYKSTLGVK